MHYVMLLMFVAGELTIDLPGRGPHIVLVSGDEEYRSEQMLPQLAKILARHHGYRCTVLFAIDADGTINPNRRDNIPGLEALESASLMVIMTRFRDLPDEQMKYIARYVEAGKPIVGIRTATHAFDVAKGKTYERYGWRQPEGGFGRRVLGETWIKHHGQHGKQSTRGVIVPGRERHPILRGIKAGEIWGPTDVYEVTMPLPGDSMALVLGQVLSGMSPDDAPAEGSVNTPMRPVAWVKTNNGGRVFTTTMGSAQDLSNEGFRRMLVNACYWALGREKSIKRKSKVGIVGDYNPLPFKFGGYRQGVKPADLAATNQAGTPECI